MTRAWIAFVLVICGISNVISQQSRASFDVASVRKRTTTVSGARDIRTAGVFDVQNQTLSALILYAYDIVEQQLVGLPDWGRSDRFDIAARAAGDATDEQLREMMRTLLEERFRLVTHTELRPLPHYELRLTRTSGQLGPNVHVVSSCLPEDRPKRPRPPRNALSTGGCGPVSLIARHASRRIGAYVSDGTGLSGIFDFMLYLSPEETVRFGFRPIPEALVNESGLPGFETGLRDQLGLKLERVDRPVPVIVIVAVQQPTDN